MPTDNTDSKATSGKTADAGKSSQGINFLQVPANKTAQDGPPMFVFGQDNTTAKTGQQQPVELPADKPADTPTTK